MRFNNIKWVMTNCVLQSLSYCLCVYTMINNINEFTFVFNMYEDVVWLATISNQFAMHTLK